MSTVNTPSHIVWCLAVGQRVRVRVRVRVTSYGGVTGTYGR